MNLNKKPIKTLIALITLSAMAITPIICTAEAITTESPATIAYNAVSSLDQNRPIHPIITTTHHNDVHPLSTPNDHNKNILNKGKKSCKRQFFEQAVKRNLWGAVWVGLTCPTTVYSY